MIDRGRIAVREVAGGQRPQEERVAALEARRRSWPGPRTSPGPRTAPNGAVALRGTPRSCAACARPAAARSARGRRSAPPRGRRRRRPPRTPVQRVEEAHELVGVEHLVRIVPHGHDIGDHPVDLVLQLRDVAGVGQQGVAVERQAARSLDVVPELAAEPANLSRSPMSADEPGDPRGRWAGRARGPGRAGPRPRSGADRRCRRRRPGSCPADGPAPGP